ncbi:hypothetical protein I6M49_22270 [Shewanella algae]|uniref:hypothetical protein n=1 Tax=Shewanella algae TaxID=38313 RepID=UPI001AAD16BB|nr:hypothetical protein [Shewanella algae]MBO2656172.1 hypothetical protein [Shewanella algae]
MLAQYDADGKTLAEFKADLTRLFGAMDDAESQRLLSEALMLDFAKGASDAH